MDQAPSPNVIRQYCAIIFGPAFAESPEFLEALDCSTLKQAYREKALVTHPDRAGILGRDEAHLAEDFKQLGVAYRALNEILLTERDLIINSAGSVRETVKKATFAAAFNAVRNAAFGRGKKRQKESQTTGSDWQQAFNQHSHEQQARQQQEQARRARDEEARNREFRQRQAAYQQQAYQRQYQEQAYQQKAWREAHHFRPDRYYQGSIPARSLMFAEYLYYTGVISWKELIGSLVWQRRERPRIGEIAVRWDLLTPHKVQAINTVRQVRERFGEAAVRQGYLSQFWVNTLLKGQQMLQHPIGQYFVCEGVITRQDLFVNLARQRQHNRLHTPLD